MCNDIISSYLYKDIYLPNYQNNIQILADFQIIGGICELKLICPDNKSTQNFMLKCDLICENPT